jgi:hypothetical protein
MVEAEPVVSSVLVQAIPVDGEIVPEEKQLDPRDGGSIMARRKRLAMLLVVACITIAAVTIGIMVWAQARSTAQQGTTSTTAEKFYQSLPSYAKESIHLLGSPQRLAYLWVTTADQFPQQVAPEDEATRLFRMMQRFALATLWHASDGVDSFDPTASECLWFYNVACVDGSTVDHLGPIGTGGTIPREVALLTSLTELTLNQNQRASTIPTELGLLTRLAVLNLGRNQLTSTIPTELGRLSLLEQLWVDENLLVGTFPTAMCRLPNYDSTSPRVDCAEVSCTCCIGCGS